MREGSLFAGYGGLSMAASEVLGCETVWFVENDTAASKVLAHHWDVPNHGDITAIDWTAVEPVDVLTGGFPCQDISSAGKRAGIEGERSGLWSYFADAIGTLRPRYVLVENVAALLVRGFDTVAADLAGLGYRFAWCVLGAADVGAPHRRNRVFLVATSDSSSDGRHEGRAEPEGIVGGPDAAVSSAPSPDAECDPLRQQPVSQSGRGGASIAGLDYAATADADGDGREGEPQRHGEPLDERAPLGDDPDGRVLDWGPYEPAVRRWESVLGRPAPQPTVTGARGGRVLSPVFVEWLMGLHAGHVTDVPGLSRNDILRLLGNGVVPMQAVAAYRHLLPLLDSERLAS